MEEEDPRLHCPEKHLSPPTGRHEPSIGSHGHCQWSQAGRLGELEGERKIDFQIISQSIVVKEEKRPKQS